MTAGCECGRVTRSGDTPRLASPREGIVEMGENRGRSDGTGLRLLYSISGNGDMSTVADVRVSGRSSIDSNRISSGRRADDDGCVGRSEGWMGTWDDSGSFLYSSDSS